MQNSATSLTKSMNPTTLVTASAGRLNGLYSSTLGETSLASENDENPSKKTMESTDFNQSKYDLFDSSSIQPIQQWMSPKEDPVWKVSMVNKSNPFVGYFTSHWWSQQDSSSSSSSTAATTTSKRTKASSSSSLRFPSSTNHSNSKVSSSFQSKYSKIQQFVLTSKDSKEIEGKAKKNTRKWNPKQLNPTNSIPRKIRLHRHQSTSVYETSSPSITQFHSVSSLIKEISNGSGQEKFNPSTSSIQPEKENEKEESMRIHSIDKDESTKEDFDLFDTLLPLPTTSSISSPYQLEYQELNLLGSGGQGSVYHVRNRIDLQDYAIKKIPIPYHLSPSQQLEKLREVRTMACLPPHSNVVRYHHAWVERNEKTSPFQNSKEPKKTTNQLLFTNENPPSNSFSNQMDPIADDMTYSNPIEDWSTFSSPSEIGFEFEFESNDPNFKGTSISSMKKLKKEPLVLELNEKSTKDSLIMYIQMEFCGKKSSCSQPYTLCNWLRENSIRKSDLTEKIQTLYHHESLNLFVQVLQGVKHLHQNGILHRDLKPENIFLQPFKNSNQYLAKIGDFGLAKHCPQSSFLPTFSSSSNSKSKSKSKTNSVLPHTTELGTYLYASPEQLGASNKMSEKSTKPMFSTGLYTEKSDVFSLGIILLELCSDFQTMMERAQVLSSVRHGVIPSHLMNLYPTEMQLILRMTSTDPMERPTLDDILSILSSIDSTLYLPHTMATRQVCLQFETLQRKLAQTVYQLREQSHASMQLKSLISEFSDSLEQFQISNCMKPSLSPSS